MSIPIEKLSLLGAILPQRQRIDNNGITADGLFAEKFDKALGGEVASTANANARDVAEALTLQMMQSSIDLAGNSNSETAPSSGSSQYSPINSFLQAYRANLASKGGETISSLKTSSAQTLNLTDSTSVATPVQTKTPIAAQHETVAWLDPIILKASRKYGVDVSLIRAVIKAESNFNPDALSRVGAAGLMQLMPATARSLGVTDSFDPEQNVMAGTRFLKDLLQRYGGDVDSALAAYNWGPGNVDRHTQNLPRETRDYLVRVKQLYSSYNG